MKEILINNKGLFDLVEKELAEMEQFRLRISAIWVEWKQHWQSLPKRKAGKHAEIRRLTVEFAKKGIPQAEGFLREYLEKMEGNE